MTTYGSNLKNNAHDNLKKKNIFSGKKKDKQCSSILNPLNTEGRSW